MIRKLNKGLWLLILCCSIPVAVWVWINEGFIQGKAYMMLLAGLIAAWGFGFRNLAFWKR